MTVARKEEMEPEVWQWRMLLAGCALALSVYYINYATGFDENEAGSSNVFTQLGRLVAVALMVLALRPIRLRIDSALALTSLLSLALLSLLLAWATTGYTNDTLFINTILQLPVLLALNGTRLRVDYARWLRFLVWLVAFQAMIDAIIVMRGSALWISEAFVGGVGNPSSFGLICVLACAFCLLHPQAGRGRRPLAGWLAIAAIMTKSLFAVFGLAIIAAIWASRSWRRLVTSLILACAASMTLYYFAVGVIDNDDPGFLEHKVLAAGALLGFGSYDVESAGSVTGRLEIHQLTYNALRDEPWRLLVGHLQGQVYWPMDSQVLTYLGSFGVAMLLAFLSIHLLWTYRAWANAHNEGGFSFVALLIFSSIFLTNRILDYFPVASMYFICVMSAGRAGYRADKLAFDPHISPSSAG
jgi:hypothetical protein